MGIVKALLGGAALGAGAMYFLDPRLGNRRRAMAADQLRRLSRQTNEGVDAGLRDLGNRGQGLLHELGSILAPSVGRHHRVTNRSFQWSPGPRLVAAACGTALMGNCVACRTPSALTDVSAIPGCRLYTLRGWFW